MVFLFERRCYCVVYLGYGIVYLGYGVPTGTLGCECCLPWVWCSSACARMLSLRARAGEGSGPSPGAPCAGAVCGAVGCAVGYTQPG